MVARMREILDGLWHFSARHERIDTDVSSYWYASGRVLIDPMRPSGGIDALPGEDQPVAPFDFGDELPGGAVAHDVGTISPDETALHLPGLAAVAFADGLVRIPPDAPLGFVPDELIGDDPEGVKEGLRERYRRLLDEARARPPAPSRTATPWSETAERRSSAS
jgi:hypothetical protein